MIHVTYDKMITGNLICCNFSVQFLGISNLDSSEVQVKLLFFEKLFLLQKHYVKFKLFFFFLQNPLKLTKSSYKHIGQEFLTRNKKSNFHGFVYILQTVVKSIKTIFSDSGVVYTLFYNF